VSIGSSPEWWSRLRFTTWTSDGILRHPSFAFSASLCVQTTAGPSAVTGTIAAMVVGDQSSLQVFSSCGKAWKLCQTAESDSSLSAGRVERRLSSDCQAYGILGKGDAVAIHCSRMLRSQPNLLATRWLRAERRAKAITAF
jgi:hypothetical protein